MEETLEQKEGREEIGRRGRRGEVGACSGGTKGGGRDKGKDGRGRTVVYGARRRMGRTNVGKGKDVVRCICQVCKKKQTESDTHITHDKTTTDS